MLLRKIKMALTRSAFLGSCVLGGLKLAKNYKLAQAADKDKVYGALKEFTNNPRLWRSSPVGREYCHLTEEGREVIADMMQDILRTVDVLERKAVDQRAKEIVFETLKGKVD
jgi:hypothetical protein